MPNKTKECPYCYSKIDSRATVCPNCRSPIQAQDDQPYKDDQTDKDSKSSSSYQKWIPGIGIGLLVLMILCCSAFWIIYQTQFAPSPPVGQGAASQFVGTTGEVDNLVVGGWGTVSAEGEIVPIKSADLAFIDDSKVSEVLVAEGDFVEAGMVLVKSEDAVSDEHLAEQLHAPFSGTVSGIFVTEGEIALKGVPVIALADLSELQIKTTDLTELDVVAVKNGLPAVARFDALPGEEVRGTVADIASLASLVRGDVTYEVTVTIDDNQDLPLRWGMTSHVDIEVTEETAPFELSGETVSSERPVEVSLGVVGAEGIIVPANEAVLSFLDDRRVAEVLVTEGERVEAGAKLVHSEGDGARNRQEEILIAPFSGTVAAIEVSQGETALAGEPVIIIADFDQWEIKTTDLQELDVVDLKVGDNVEISVDSLLGVNVRGKVAKIANRSEIIRGDVTYEVTIIPEDTDSLPLRWGMTTFVDVHVE